MATLRIIRSKANGIDTMCEFANEYRVWGYGDFDAASIAEIIAEAGEPITLVTNRGALSDTDYDTVRKFCAANGIEFRGYLGG